MGNRKILVTGATGYIASQLLPALQETYELTLLDVGKRIQKGKRFPG